MNISAQVASAAAAGTRAAVDRVNATRATSTKTVDAAAQANSSRVTSSDAGPAARVTISSKAREQLRAAGVPSGEIAKVNLADKNAVARAIQRARMSRGKSNAKGSSAIDSGSAKTNGPSATVSGPSNAVRNAAIASTDAAHDDGDAEDAATDGYAVENDSETLAKPQKTE